MVLNSYFKYFCKLCHVFLKLNKTVIIIIIKDKIISARNNAYQKEAGESLLLDRYLKY